MAIYTNIVSNKMYGAFIGVGNEWWLGNGLSLSLDLEATGYIDFVKERARMSSARRRRRPNVPSMTTRLFRKSAPT